MSLHPFLHHPLRDAAVAATLTRHDIVYGEPTTYEATIFIRPPVPKEFLVATFEHNRLEEFTVDFLPPIQVVVTSPPSLIQKSTAAALAAAEKLVTDAVAAAEKDGDRLRRAEDEVARAKPAADAAAHAAADVDADTQFTLAFSCPWLKISQLKIIARLVDKSWDANAALDHQALKASLEYLVFRLPWAVREALGLSTSLDLRWKACPGTPLPGTPPNVRQGQPRYLRCRPPTKNFIAKSILRDFVPALPKYRLVEYSKRTSEMFFHGILRARCAVGVCSIKEKGKPDPPDVLPTRTLFASGCMGGLGGHLVCVSCLRDQLDSIPYAYYCPVVKDAAPGDEGAKPVQCPGLFSEDQVVLAATDAGPTGKLQNRCRYSYRCRRDFEQYNRDMAQGLADYRGNKNYPCPKCTKFVRSQEIMERENISICPHCVICFCSTCLDVEERRLLCHKTDCDCTECKSMKWYCKTYCGLKVLLMHVTREECKALIRSKYEGVAEDYVRDGIVHAQKQLEAIARNRTCPCCFVPIRKEGGGCPKMECGECGTLFCWVCLTDLPKVDTYLHFTITDCVFDVSAYM